jgi:predicted nucleic acid-binding protein
VIALYDTSALILAAHHADVARELADALAVDEVAICPPVRLEYLNGARNAAEYERFDAVLGALRWLAVEALDWDRALGVHGRLAAIAPGQQRGVRLVDLIVAAVAERNALPLVHYDADYDRIAAITGQATRWIVPRGSV